MVQPVILVIPYCIDIFRHELPQNVHWHPKHFPEYFHMTNTTWTFLSGKVLAIVWSNLCRYLRSHNQPLQKMSGNCQAPSVHVWKQFVTLVIQCTVLSYVCINRNNYVNKENYCVEYFNAKHHRSPCHHPWSQWAEVFWKAEPHWDSFMPELAWGTRRAVRKKVTFTWLKTMFTTDKLRDTAKTVAWNAIM